MSKVINRWNMDGGYRQLLKIALPLVLSTSAWSIQHFVDRMFLTWYSIEGVAAALQASMVFFTLVSIFIGTGSYCNTFVAQYIGAGNPKMVGKAMWQGIYFSIGSSIFLLICIPLARPIFGIFGHDPVIFELEVVYFRYLIGGAVFFLLGNTASTFYSGRGKTWTIMWVNFTAVAVNIVLNYVLIFGRWGFPELGVTGAALGTIIAHFVSAFFFIYIMFLKKHRDEFAIWSERVFNRRIFSRLLFFGVPAGFTIFFDVIVWTIFLGLTGKIGVIELSASSIAFNINTLAFMPIFGIGIAVQTLVGQRLGENRPIPAVQTTYSGLHISSLYMVSIGLMYWFLPEIFIAPFKVYADPERFREVHSIIIVILKFIAVYTVFDGINIIVSGALKGAGDTRFPVVVTFILGWVAMVIPIIYLFKAGYRSIYLTWSLAVAYLGLLSLVMTIRFLMGKWKTMRVIEETPPPRVIPYPAVPPTEPE